ncbi:MAG: hypothetical protein V1732_03560 [Patescibacteria group bacterium]
MKQKTSEKITQYIQSHKQATAKELLDYLAMSPRAVFKQLANLLEKGEITKIGRPPKVFYSLAKISVLSPELYEIEKKTEKAIENNFLIITPAGEKKEGLDGFIYWCRKNNQPISKTAKEYAKTLKKYDAFKKNGLIDGMRKMESTFKKVYLDGLFYLDFYSIERFGKTKLGQLLLYAKQSQNKILMKDLIISIKPQIDFIVKKFNIDAIGFIPPTVKRETQFMKELQKNLRLEIPVIPIIKVKTPIAVPQKTLNKLEDRIENARKTIIIEGTVSHKNILFIDDAVGSGATLNETAGQLRAKGMAKGKIIGLVITGSYKGFDVISEV